MAKNRRDLSVRGVKQMLTRGGVDHRNLAFTERTITILNEGCRRSTEVEIRGPKELRSAAFLVLFETGLWCAPYPDKDLWHRD